MRDVGLHPCTVAVDRRLDQSNTSQGFCEHVSLLVVEDFDGARVNPDWDALRVDALFVFVVSVIDVVVLLVWLTF